jgi:hypothetical protein
MVQDAVAVGAQGAGERDERSESGARGPGQPGVEVRRREGRVVEVVEQSELLAQQEGAVEARVGLLDFAEGCQLAEGLAFGRLEQRPAGALDPAPRRRVGALVGVPLVAAHLLGGAAGEAADVEGVKADGVGDRGADGALYSPLMSIETARIDALRSPSSVKKPCKVALLRPGAHHTIAPVRWSATEVW